MRRKTFLNFMSQYLIKKFCQEFAKLYFQFCFADVCNPLWKNKQVGAIHYRAYSYSFKARHKIQRATGVAFDENRKCIAHLQHVIPMATTGFPTWTPTLMAISTGTLAISRMFGTTTTFPSASATYWFSPLSCLRRGGVFILFFLECLFSSRRVVVQFHQ